MPNKSDFIDLGGGATPRPREDPKVLLESSGDPKIFKGHNFDTIRKKLKDTGKLDLQDFNSIKEMGMFIDWMNSTIKESKDRRFGDDVISISRALVDGLTKSYFVMGKPIDLQKPPTKI